MKLMWFHSKRYMELPDDFRDNDHSTWAGIRSRLLNDERSGHWRFNPLPDARPMRASATKMMAAE